MSYPNFTKSCCQLSHSKQTDSHSTCHEQSSGSFTCRYVNMTTVLSRTASCHNASLLQYSPGNDLQVDPETDCLEGPAMVERATILLVPRLTHCHRLCACVVLIIILCLKHGVHYRHSPQGCVAAGSTVADKLATACRQ